MAVAEEEEEEEEEAATAGTRQFVEAILRQQFCCALSGIIIHHHHHQRHRSALPAFSFQCAACSTSGHFDLLYQGRFTCWRQLSRDRQLLQRAAMFRSQ